MSNVNRNPPSAPTTSGSTTANSLTTDLVMCIQEGNRVDLTPAQLLAGMGAIRTSSAAATTLSLSDVTVVCDATSGAITATLPSAASAAGREYVIKKKDSSANAVTLKGNGSELIDGANTKATTTQYATIRAQSDGAQWWTK